MLHDDCKIVFFMSGRIDATEIQQSLAELGLDISKVDALKILQRFAHQLVCLVFPATMKIQSRFLFAVMLHQLGIWTFLYFEKAY